LEEKQMIRNFLQGCINTKPEEADAYSELVREFREDKRFVGIMPSICPDIWPIHVMEETEAIKYNGTRGESVYFAPVVTHGEYYKKTFEGLFEDYYQEGEWVKLESFTYRARVLKTVMLYSCDVDGRTSSYTLGRPNVMYVCYQMRCGRRVHIFYIADKAKNVWENIIERYLIKTNIVINSHKGMGDWFANTELYEYLTKAANKTLLPKYYFKGKYISHEAPEGFELIYSVPESDKYDCISRIYLTNWQK